MASPLLVLAFPKLRTWAEGAGAVVLYALAYFCSSSAAALLSNPERRLDDLYLAVLLFGCVLGGSVVAMLLTLRSPHPRLALRLLAPFAMVGLGLLTAFLSGPQGGPGRLMHFLLEVLHIDLQTATNINYIVRKSTHLSLYGLLGLSAAVVALRQGQSSRGAWAAGLGWALTHALLDESHQTTSVVRTGSWGDVLIDLTGASLCLLAMTLWTKRSVQKRQGVAEP